MATGADSQWSSAFTRSTEDMGKEKRRIPLSRLDTHRDQRIVWENEEDGQVARDTLQKMSAALSTLVECVGDKPEREGLKRTPMRAAKALCYFTKGYEDNLQSKRTCSIQRSKGAGASSMYIRHYVSCHIHSPVLDCLANHLTCVCVCV